MPQNINIEDYAKTSLLALVYRIASVNKITTETAAQTVVDLAAYVKDHLPPAPAQTP